MALKQDMKEALNDLQNDIVENFIRQAPDRSDYDNLLDLTDSCFDGEDDEELIAEVKGILETGSVSGSSKQAIEATKNIVIDYLTGDSVPSDENSAFDAGRYVAYDQAIEVLSSLK